MKRTIYETQNYCRLRRCGCDLYDGGGRIKELCQSHNIPVELIQCRVNEIETYMDGVHLICTTARVDRSFGNIPLVHGMPFVSGVGIEALQNKILTILQG